MVRNIYHRGAEGTEGLVEHFHLLKLFYIMCLKATYGLVLTFMAAHLAGCLFRMPLKHETWLVVPSPSGELEAVVYYVGGGVASSSDTVIRISRPSQADHAHMLAIPGSAIAYPVWLDDESLVIEVIDKGDVEQYQGYKADGKAPNLDIEVWNPPAVEQVQLDSLHSKSESVRFGVLKYSYYSEFGSVTRVFTVVAVEHGTNFKYSQRIAVYIGDWPLNLVWSGSSHTLRVSNVPTDQSAVYFVNERLFVPSEIRIEYGN